MRLGALVAMAALTMSCSEATTRTPGGNGGGDAANGRDATAPVRFDATPEDAGPEADAGAADLGVDTGAARDVGPADSRVDVGGVDAAPPADVGFDAGVSVDATSVDASGPVDAGDARCTFGVSMTVVYDPRTPIDASRLDDLESCVAQDPGRAGALVDGFLAEVDAHGGAHPWRNGNSLVLFRGDALGLTVSGSFDGWPAPGRRGFRNIPGTDLHVAEIPVGNNERMQYKLTRSSGGGVDWFSNPNGRYVRWDGIPRNGLGEFNNELAGPAYTIGNESFLHHRVIAGRPVYLQIPVAYYTPGSTYGVLYVHDGNEMLTRANMQAVADQTFLDQRATPTFIAYVALENQNLRNSEYSYGPNTTGDAYINALADMIAPEVERHLPLATMPDARGLAGASLGGLISFHGAWIRNDAFRLIGAQSPSLWWANGEMEMRFAAGPMIDARVYLDSGSPNDNFDSTESMAARLMMLGYDHLRVTEPGGRHEWPFWAGRFDELLEYLYP